MIWDPNTEMSKWSMKEIKTIELMWKTSTLPNRLYDLT